MNRRSKAIRISDAAEILGCGRDKAKQLARQNNWKMWRNGDGPTEPWLVNQADVEAFRQRREALR